jgi:lambda family phage portal protein
MSKRERQLERKLAKLRANPPGLETRGYREVVAVGGQNSDWPVNVLSEDSEIWQNIFMLRARMRDLWRTNPYFDKYRNQIASNVFGIQGIMLRMKIKETEDRVIHSADEKWMLVEHERRVNQIREWAQSKTETQLQAYRAYTLADRLERAKPDDILTKKATIKVGDPDLFANKLIQDKWKEWQRAEYCDARGQRNYWTLRLLRLWACARDGDFFIRKIESPKANKFGFTLQFINSEWCDHFYNATLSNGNEVRMGIEYEKMTWGIGKVVAYYLIKRQPQDWQFSVPGSFNFAAGTLHDRIPAKEIIHYARYTDADGTRPAPWGASTIPKSRGLDQYELAEVFAARAMACKTGWLTSTQVPEGGTGVGMLPPKYAGANGGGYSAMMGDVAREIVMEPGGIYGLPWGVDFKPNDPTHPSGNFENFRKGMLRSWCAGMPGADYNAIANDLEGISFSSGRLGRLDVTRCALLLQNFDIESAERPIFEAWLENALFNGAVPLPPSKYDKYNKPVFQGTREHQVDEVKEVNASALRVANLFSSRTKECADDGTEFAENLMEQAEEIMAAEEFGIDCTSTAAKAPQKPEQEEDGEDSENEEEDEEKPAAKPKEDDDEHDSTLKFARL